MELAEKRKHQSKDAAVLSFPQQSMHHVLEFPPDPNGSETNMLVTLLLTIIILLLCQ